MIFSILMLVLNQAFGVLSICTSAFDNQLRSFKQRIQSPEFHPGGLACHSDPNCKGFIWMTNDTAAFIPPNGLAGTMATPNVFAKIVTKRNQNVTHFKHLDDEGFKDVEAKAEELGFTDRFTYDFGGMKIVKYYKRDAQSPSNTREMAKRCLNSGGTLPVTYSMDGAKQLAAGLKVEDFQTGLYHYAEPGPGYTLMTWADGMNAFPPDARQVVHNKAVVCAHRFWVAYVGNELLMYSGYGGENIFIGLIQ